MTSRQLIPRQFVLWVIASLAISAFLLVDGTYSRAVPDNLVADAEQQDLLGYGFWFLWIPFSLAQIIVLVMIMREPAVKWKSILFSLCLSVFVAASLYSYVGYESLKSRVSAQ